MISVVIPTLNGGQRLDGLFSALRRQTLEHEIIVVDSSSSDDSVLIAEGWGATVIRIPRSDFDHGGTRNLAARHARGDVLAFLTQDALPRSTDYLQLLTAPLSDPSVAAAYGRQVPSSDAKPLERFARLFNYPSSSLTKDLRDLTRLGIKTFYFTNVCSAVRKTEFVETGGFPSKIIMNEDMMLAARLILKGYRIAYVAEAAVVHSHNYTIKQQFHRYFDIGVSFATNNWLMAHAKADREGLRLVTEGVRYLLDEKKKRLLLLFAIDTIARFLGFKLGLHHQTLPLAVRRSLSMHRGYWRP